MKNIRIQVSLYLVVCFTYTNAFVPTPFVAAAGQTTDSISHTEITQIAFTRTLARFFYDTRIRPDNNNGGTVVNEQTYFAQEYTIDQLYKIAHPEYSQSQVTLYSLPMKYILDMIMAQNALVDLDSTTQTLAAAHFDSEAFQNGSRRILQLRSTNLTNARQLLGQLLHTLQDFYSHSNWVEMGKTTINELIGVSETIGTVAEPNQPTCSNDGCTRIEKPCTLWERITLDACPVVYYDCQNNILPTINQQQILTSGYLVNQHDKYNNRINKPANVGKCSHGSILYSSSRTQAIGGINKDSTSLVFSPHANLHYEAVRLAVNATEKFLNDLRRDIGDQNFDRLFTIHPLLSQAQAASNDFAKGKRFQVFIPLLTAIVKESSHALTSFISLTKTPLSMIRTRLTNIFSSKSNLPTYDLDVNDADSNDLDVALYIFADGNTRRKKRYIDAVRKRN